jgi:hypothetical protein
VPSIDNELSGYADTDRHLSDLWNCDSLHGRWLVGVKRSQTGWPNGTGIGGLSVVGRTTLLTDLSFQLAQQRVLM